MRYLWQIIILIFPTVGLAENELYDFSWMDKGRKIYILQNKVYEKKGTSYANMGFLIGPNSSYRDSKGVQLTLGFYMGESWIIEGFYHLYFGQDNEDSKKLKEINNTIPFVRRLKSKAGGMLLWSPFYGKINLFNSILYFDWSLGIGGGLLSAEDNAKTVAFRQVADKYEEESYKSFMAKTALKVYISKRYHVNLEYHWDYYSAKNVQLNKGIDPGSSSSSLSSFSFNLGMSFR